jgi:esterase/lipase
MKKKLKVFLFISGILVVVYFLGPRPRSPKYDLKLPEINIPVSAMDSFVASKESGFAIKPDNEARIIWADSLKQKTPYSILYLPGFTASQEEGDPIHTNIAKKFGCNLYLARLYGHGLNDSLHTFADFTADKFWESTKEAFAIAKQLGNKVLLMSTSTGGTVSLKLAAEYDDIAGLILLSPNIAINDPNAWLLNNPWGKQIAKLVKGSGTLYSKRQDSLYRKYWYTRYDINGAVELEELLESSMTIQTFKKITEPLCLLYYYKDEKNQDPVVKVSAMKDMFEKVSTPASKKQQFAIPNAGKHVLGSYIESKDLVTVEEKITAFIENILQIKRVH